VILTSASRSGGEVRITETERSDPIPAGQRGCRSEIVVRSFCACGRSALLSIFGVCRALLQAAGRDEVIPDRRPD